jgi:hypothetical protein
MFIAALWSRCTTNPQLIQRCSRMARDLRILARNRVKFLHDIQCSLVMKVSSLPRNFLMLLRQKFDCLSSSVASFVTPARDLALRGFQPPLRSSQILRIRYRLAHRKSRKVLYPYIYSRSLACFRKEAALILFHRKDHIPTVSFTLYRAGFDSAFNGTRKMNTTRSDSG